ncbi:MAG: ATP-dependent DNA helicase RecG [Sulfuricella sp.]|nr:ATP-dependent DNA helicase RecG [Sulfuricella sp.]
MTWKIGNAAREKLAKLGVNRPFDLLLHLPLRYEDETHLYPIADAPLGQTVQVEGRVVHCQAQYRPRKALVCRIEDGGGEIFLRFLHFYPSQLKTLAEGKTVRALGELRHGYHGLEMVHPRYRVVGEEAPLAEALTPIYPTTAGLSQDSLRKHIRQALASENLADTLPEKLREQHRLADFAASLAYLHQPPPDAAQMALVERTHPAWQRLAFDELLAQQLSMRHHYRQRRSFDAPPLAPSGALSQAFLRSLPFALTGAQHKVLAEIRRDLGQPHPMQRLLQGDVGSGKTVVAALAALQAIENGYQAALMAPTEILAEQHFLKLAGWLEGLGVKTAWLASRLSAKEKRAALEKAASGEAQLVVGTHALFQEQVEFHNLAVAVIDEQHRFGVHQRLALRQKGRAAVHQLMMSATPIPRTLSMSYYADLDVSVIDELPPGRTPVLTRLVSDARRDEVVTRVRAACLDGRQAYWVCPLIEESETLQLKTAVETYETLATTFPDLNIGLVHGRLPGAEKAEVMAAFKRGDLHLLVATTVIEVGVDVPNASLMVIEHAERMGLSQLHQLRGRVGRGAMASVCLLLYQQPLSELARERLKIIHDSSDGFEIARRDLQLRGPGEFLGARQSGVPMLRVADLERDADLLDLARDTAQSLLQDYPEHAARHLERWLGGRQDYLKT